MFARGTALLLPFLPSFGGCGCSGAMDPPWWMALPLDDGAATLDKCRIAWRCARPLRALFKLLFTVLMAFFVRLLLRAVCFPSCVFLSCVSPRVFPLFLNFPGFLCCLCVFVSVCACVWFPWELCVSEVCFFQVFGLLSS